MCHQPCTDIHFLSHKPIRSYGTTMMRCLQPVDYLAEKGWKSQASHIYDTFPGPADIVILHRVALDDVTNTVIELSRAMGSILVYDTDDFIYSDEAFPPDVAQSRQAVMRHCDVIVVSTDYLATKAEPFGADIRVIRNGLSHKYISRADDIFQSRFSRKQLQRTLTIGYCSGSAHHDGDLSTILPVLERILDANPATRFHLVGKINLPDSLRRFGERVTLESFIPYDQFPYVYSEIDISIAPLRLDNPFVLGRSEIKYTEAAACGVVTVASPGDAYRHAISNGFNGMLAEPERWQEVLQFLIDHPRLRDQLGINARRHVLEEYGPQKRAQEWNEFLLDVTARYQNQKQSCGKKPRRRHTKNLLRLFYFQRRRAVLRSLRRFLRNGDRRPKNDANTLLDGRFRSEPN